MSPARGPGETDARWPRWVYGQGREPDPRFTFANERTFLAWIRTGLGFLAAGVGIATIARLTSDLGVEVRLAASLLVLCGLGCAVGAFTRWMGNERAMRRGEPLSSSRLLLVVAGVVSAVGLVALVVIALA